MSLSNLLTQPWWQGVAGIAQIIAGFLAAYTVWQVARERREAVMPDWFIDPDESRTTLLDDSMPTQLPKVVRTFVLLTNTGLGPARLVRVWFEPTTGPKPAACRPLNEPGYHPSGARLQVAIDWDPDDPPGGRLRIESYSQFGIWVEQVHRLQFQQNRNPATKMPIFSMSSELGPPKAVSWARVRYARLKGRVNKRGDS